MNQEQFITVDQKIIEVINFNETKFNRWSIGLCSETPTIKHIYMNQVDLIFDLLERFSINPLKVEYLQFHKNLYYEMNFSELISRFMSGNDENKVRHITYEGYIREMDQKEVDERNKGKNQQEVLQEPENGGVEERRMPSSQ